MASKKPSGLGRGLGALLGDDVLKAESTGSLYLPISQVESCSSQPRKHFDEASLAELADSIREHGIIQPLTVRKLASGYYQIIAGERRWRAARLAGLQEVPVIVMEADDRKAAELAMIENLQREDLNPIEEAAGFQSLMETYHMTQEEAASRVGKSRSAVANALRLLSLTPPVAKLVEEGKLSAGHARALLPLSPALQEKYLGVALEKAERLEDLINEFFDITRFNLTHLTLDVSRINLTRMLEQTLYEFAPMFAEKQLDTSVQVPADLYFLCDPDKLQRVLDNLLRNAVNYSFPESVIKIRLYVDMGILTLIVENEGSTIPPEKLERIFEQFFRLDSSRASRNGGAGLGLAIAKEIVELHGGKISAESHDNHVIFQVDLPYSSGNR